MEQVSTLSVPYLACSIIASSDKPEIIEILLITIFIKATVS